jgi:hypothetical protein
MVRPRLGPISRHHTDSAPRSAAPAARVLVDTTPRSQRYLAALSRLDASAQLTPAQLREIIDDFHREFAERWAPVPVGFVSKCFLGHPFEVHTLTPDGAILEHYRIGEPMPGPLESARKHSLSGLYLAIEVYDNRLVCVRTDGTTVTLGGQDA